MGFQTSGASLAGGEPGHGPGASDIDVIEVLLPDTSGILRGKWLPGSALEKVLADGVAMPMSMFGLDVWGREVEETGIHIETGDKDGLCRPVPGTLKPVPWAPRPAMQTLVSMYRPDGSPWELDPRHALQAAVDRLAARGLTPVVAFELEFYLLEAECAADGTPRTVFDRGAGPARQNMYAIADLDEHAAMLHEMREAARIQGLPADSIISEAAPGQFEINLYHRADAMAAADDAVLLRRLIQGVARRHGRRGTFMAKPYMAAAGSGMHVHCSLLDKDGANVFAGAGAGEARLRHAVGGLLDTMPGAALLFVSSYNGFRRLMPGSYAPVSLTWGYDNRSVALRIPNGKPAATRIEHRIAGADANPYLVLAAILAGIEEGLERRAEAPEPVAGNAYDLGAERLSGSMREAVAAFRASPFCRRVFGETYVRVYSVMKEMECAEFERRISRLEYETYL
ncbi:glutamine synthetase family protein [Labrys wisconsinensis]|uniref:Glutamine synthetase n=1 Tax=Labrys wisconsinensis TaxID=425677 RepID=A0ABU0J0T3_9HYPH|nr:glutamine synthetase family protein [Labrys wisconsinensis]MDQ0467235.1 glutamine synthetase [Labrys wisconsinensis]